MHRLIFSILLIACPAAIAREVSRAPVATHPEYTILTIAGNGEEGFGGDGGGALCARLNRPTGVDVDGDGSIYIADYNNNRIRRVAPDGTISTVAGSGERGFSGDGGPAIASQLAGPYGVRVVSDGFLIADAVNGRIRHVGRDGIIRTVAGGFQHPVDVVRGPDGLLYVAEGGGNRVRRILPDGTVEPFAGSGRLRYNGESGLAGDGGPALEAQLSTPAALAFDAEGNLFIADLRNHVVRKVDTSGVITTVARTLNQPGGLAFEADGSLLISDIPRIRRLTKDGTLTTVAGSDQRGFSGDHGPATAATLSVLDLIAIDRHGHVFIADYRNNRIRKLVPKTDAATALASTPARQPAGDDVEALLSRMRASYQSVLSADVRSTIRGRRKIEGTFRYVAPANVDATLDVSDYGRVTVRADETMIRVIDPLLSAPEENPNTVQNLRRAVAANLEVISLWDSQRQLSTGEGGNMRGENLRIAEPETWGGRRWIVLEERAGTGSYRYFIDPKTAFIWRTVATSASGEVFYDGTIERLDTRRRP